MKHLKRLCVFTIVLLMILFTTAYVSYAEDAALTVMVYMCGSDLESTAGAASADLDEMIAAAPDSSVQVIVMTGGSRKWHKKEILDGVVQIHRVDGSGIKNLETLATAENPANMGDPATLTQFIDYAMSHYPADDYALVLWDHGSGPLGGVCTDELHGRDMLTLDEIQQALADSGLPGKLRWIGFDACLMGSLEVACAVNSYAETMIASQSTEPGSGWNYSFLRNIEKDADGNATGKRIVDAFFDKVNPSEDTLTMSCVDLGKIPEVIAEMDSFFGTIAEKLTEEDFPRFYSACNAVTGFARAGQTDEPGMDLVDLGGLARSLQNDNADSAGLLEALNQAVTWNRSSGVETSGLSAYHPLQNTSYYMTGWREDYNRMNGSEGYRKYISDFGKLLTSGSEADWSGMQTLSGSSGQSTQMIFALPLTEAQERDYASGKLLILMHNYKWNAADNGYALVAVSPAILGEDGMLYAGYDGRLFYAENAAGDTFGPLSPTLRQDGSLGIRAIASRVIASWEQEETRDALIYVLGEEENEEQLPVDRILIRDEASGVYSSRLPYNESLYSSVEFYGISRELPDLSGEIPAFNDWTSLYSKDENLNLPAEWHFMMTDALSAGEEMVALFEITDVHGATHCSRPVAIKTVGRTPVTITNPVMGNSEVVVEMSGELVDTPAYQGLELKISITNRTNETREFSIWNMKINGTKSIGFGNGDLAFQWDIEGNQTRSGALLIDASQLAGIDEIRDVRFDLQTGLNFKNRGEIKYELEDCDISSLTAAEADKNCLAETNINGIQWQLLDIRMDENGDLDLSVRIHNGTDQEYKPYTPNSGVVFDSIQLDGNYFSQKMKVASGETQDYTIHLTNTLGESTYSIDGDWGYDQPGPSGRIILTDRFLQRHGIREIRTLKFYLKEGQKWIPVEFSLETPWPIPDDGRQRQSESWTGALPAMEVMDRQVLLPLTDTEEYSLKLERVYVGRSGVAVCVEAVNQTDKPLKLTLQEMTVNDQEISYPGRNELHIIPGITTGWIICSEYAVPGGTAVETIHFTIRCMEDGSSYDLPAARDQVITIRLPENSITGKMNGQGLEAETCEAESGPELVPEDPKLFEPETKYVCIGYRSGTNASMLDKTDYMGHERFIIFHADGSVEYLIDSRYSGTDWWAIRGEKIILYKERLWNIASEGNQLVLTKNNQELRFATEAVATELAASRTPTPNPRTKSVQTNQTDSRKFPVIIPIAIIVLIVAGVAHSRRKKQAKQRATAEALKSMLKPAEHQAAQLSIKTKASVEKMTDGKPFYALYTIFEDAPFIDASYRIWLFTNEEAYNKAREAYLQDWKMKAEELKLREISPQEADKFFFTICYQFGISEVYVDREDDKRQTARYTSESADTYDRTKPNHVVTNPEARKHLIRFTLLVHSQFGASNEEKGKEYKATIAALKDAEVLILAKKNGSEMEILKGATVSGRNVNMVYTDFEAIPKNLWDQGVRTGISQRLEEVLKGTLNEHRTIALNLYSTGGGMFLDENDIRKMLDAHG